MIDQTDATFSEGIFPGEFDRDCKATALVHLYGSAFLLPKQRHNKWDEGIPTISETCPTASEPEPYGSPGPGLSGGLNSFTRNSISTTVFPTRHPLGRHSLWGIPAVHLTIITPR